MSMSFLNSFLDQVVTGDWPDRAASAAVWQCGYSADRSAVTGALPIAGRPARDER